jgi:hypothetical protein
MFKQIFLKKANNQVLLEKVGVGRRRGKGMRG